jgi:hypothetical protein
VSSQFRDILSVIVNAIELRSLLASVPVRLTMVMADSVRDGQRDPTRHGDVLQVNIYVYLSSIDSTSPTIIFSDMHEIKRIPIELSTV